MVVVYVVNKCEWKIPEICPCFEIFPESPGKVAGRQTSVVFATFCMCRGSPVTDPPNHPQRGNQAKADKHPVGGPKFRIHCV